LGRLTWSSSVPVVISGVLCSMGGAIGGGLSEGST
jgi:hypothetical protein